MPTIDQQYQNDTSQSERKEIISNEARTLYDRQKNDPAPDGRYAIVEGSLTHPDPHTRLGAVSLCSRAACR
jgi:hypothetical protein